MDRSSPGGSEKRVGLTGDPIEAEGDQHHPELLAATSTV
jgi:hypothetical protein